MKPRKRMHPTLASARAYHRLAAKAWRAGNAGEAEAYSRQAYRIKAMYDREMAAKARQAAARAKYEATRQTKP